MEITTLTTFLTPFLPYLLKLSKGAADTATEAAANKFGEAAWQKAQSLWALLSPKIEAKESAQEAAADVANDPEDEDSQAALRVQLKKLLANDEALANQLARILQQATDNNTPTTQITQTTKGNQNQTIGQISGGQVFGNVTGSVIISGSGNAVNHTHTSPAPTEPTSPEPSTAKIKTILVLAANPKGTSPLRLGEEVRAIQEGLDRSKYRDRFHIEQRWAVRPQDVQRALLDTKPQIVHFSGHGVGIATSDENETNKAATNTRKIVALPEDETLTRTEPKGLIFEDATGQSKLVSTSAIANLFSLFSDCIECVVLNACYSATQADAIAQHIPYVVGMKKAIGDPAAIKFSLGFYNGLLANRPIEFAYKLGRNAIELENIPEHFTPILKKKQQMS